MKYIDVYRMRKKADWYNPLTWFNEEPQQESREAIDKAREKLRNNPGSLTQEEAALLEKYFGQDSSDNDFQRAALDKAWETFQKDPSKLSQEDLRMLQDAGYESKQYYPYGQSPIEKQLRRRREGAGAVWQQPYYTQMKRVPYTPDILPKKTPAQIRAQLAQIRAWQQQRRKANYDLPQGESVKPQTPEERAERYARLRRTQQALAAGTPAADIPAQPTQTADIPSEQEVAANERYQQQLQAWRELYRNTSPEETPAFDSKQDYASVLSKLQEQGEKQQQQQEIARATSGAPAEESAAQQTVQSPSPQGHEMYRKQMAATPPPQYAQYKTPEKGTINGDAATIARMKQQDAAKPGITYVDPKTKQEVAVAAPQKPKAPQWKLPNGQSPQSGKWVQVDPSGARVWVKNGQTFNQNYNPEVAGTRSSYTQPQPTVTRTLPRNSPPRTTPVPPPAQTQALVAAGNETMPRRPMTPYQAQQDLMRRNRERRPKRV